MNQSLKSNSVHFERALQILKEAYEEEDYRINEVVDVWKIMTKKWRVSDIRVAYRPLKLTRSLHTKLLQRDTTLRERICSNHMLCYRHAQNAVLYAFTLLIFGGLEVFTFIACRLPPPFDDAFVHLKARRGHGPPFDMLTKSPLERSVSHFIISPIPRLLSATLSVAPLRSCQYYPCPTVSSRSSSVVASWGHSE
jgi:hypothetical protein